MTCPRRPHHRGFAAVVLVVGLLGAPPETACQGLPSEPVSLAGERLVISAEVSASMAAKDDTYLNQSDYGQNALRHLAVGMTTALSLAGPWVLRFAGRVPEAGPVLDLACGRGRHTRLFLARGHPVTAVDRDLSGIADLTGAPGGARFCTEQ